MTTFFWIGYVLMASYLVGQVIKDGRYKLVGEYAVKPKTWPAAKVG
jgi:hypothetical protein